MLLGSLSCYLYLSVFLAGPACFLPSLLLEHQMPSLDMRHNSILTLEMSLNFFQNSLVPAGWYTRQISKHKVRNLDSSSGSAVRNSEKFSSITLFPHLKNEMNYIYYTELLSGLFELNIVHVSIL